MERFQKRKIITRFLIGIVGVISVIWIIFVWNDTHISQINISEYAIYEAGSDGYEMYIDNVSCSKDDFLITKDYISIGGWIVNKNESMDQVTIDVILINTGTGIAYVIPTTVQVVLCQDLAQNKMRSSAS